jgi:hypothetical protein
MPSFEPQNETVCKQHATLFKHDQFMFHPQKDLVLSMPYQFIANLEITWSIYSIGYSVAQESGENLKKGKIELHQTN